MKLGIVTDSTCDLPADLIEQHQLEVVPAILILEGEAYADGPGISRSDFYKRLPEFKTPPTTAAPSIGEFAGRYQRLLDCGCDHIISIHAASRLTSLFSTAGQAAQEFPDQVTIVDSLSLSLGLGFQVLAAAESAGEGLAAALAAIEATRKHLRVFAALDTMEYLRRSGRLPGPIAFLGSLLNIKPIIALEAGEVKAVRAVRTTRQANTRMMDFLQGAGNLERLAILHTGAEARARAFLNQLMNEISRSLPHEIMLVNVTTVIGAHLGPGGLGFAAVRK
ncbi:MAG TPA: DegV family protein [Anaerolineales bacterium]|nr:DegV family protein [Anaerolineales bacterium]